METKPTQKIQKLYELLGVQPNATITEIKKAYRLRALQTHPDKQLSNVDKEQAAVVFQNVHRAYEILTCPERRKNYDCTGSEDSDINEINAAYEYFRSLFPRLTTNKIDDFERSYRFSTDEVSDLKLFYNFKV